MRCLLALAALDEERPPLILPLGRVVREVTQRVNVFLQNMQGDLEVPMLD